MWNCKIVLGGQYKKNEKKKQQLPHPSNTFPLFLLIFAVVRLLVHFNWHNGIFGLRFKFANRILLMSN